MPLLGLTVYAKDVRGCSLLLSSMHEESQSVLKQSGASIEEQGVAKPPETSISHPVEDPCKERNPSGMSTVFAVFCRRAAFCMPCPHMT